MFNNPAQFGFVLKASDLYVPIPYREITMTTGIDDLARWAKSQGTTYALLKNLNPWLRQNFLQNRSHRTYVLKVPLKEGLIHHPEKVVPHHKNWVTK